MPALDLNWRDFPYREDEVVLSFFDRLLEFNPDLRLRRWVGDGLKGFYGGIAPGVTGSLATGATYFGVIESTKKWIEESHPNLGGHWVIF